MEVKDAMQSAAIKLRAHVTGDTSILAPNASQPIIVDPVYESYFELSHPDGNTADQVKTVQDWLIKQGANTPNSQLDTLRAIETRLGGAEPGTRLDKVYRYVRLKNEAVSLDNQAKAMER